MPSLPSEVTNYLTTVKDSLSTGTDLGSSVRGAPLNYLRAQDMATVLRLLQDALDTGNLTAVSGTTTTFVDGAATFTANAQVGNIAVFDDATTTTALQGVEVEIASNDATTLTFAETLPAAVATGDVITIRAAFVQSAIDDLDEGKGLAASPAGSVYGEARTVADALVRLIAQLGGTLNNREIMSTTALAGTSTTEISVDAKGSTFRVDQFRGLKADVDGDVRRVVSNTEDGVLTLSPGVSTAPSGGETVSVFVAENDASVFRHRLVHPGGHQDNAVLSDLIDQAQTVVAGFTLPT